MNKRREPRIEQVPTTLHLAIVAAALVSLLIAMLIVAAFDMYQGELDLNKALEIIFIACLTLFSLLWTVLILINMRKKR